MAISVKRLSCLAAVVVVVQVLGMSMSQAAEEAWSVDASADVYGKYVWRGIVLTNEPVLQPAVGVSYGGLALSIWGNLEMTDINDSSGDFTEVDYTAEYSVSWEGWSFSAGVIFYDFPSTVFPSTTEIYGAVGMDTLLSPTLTVYQDVDEADGTYANFSVEHSLADVFSPWGTTSASVVFSASVGYGSSDYNEFYFGADESAFTDALFSISMPIQVHEAVSVSPSISFSTLLDDSVRKAMDDDDNVWAGVSVAFSQ